MEFEHGLCVLTGETGAGKSILLGALNLLLGERASGQPLFNPEQAATLTAECDLTEKLEALCEENGLSIEEDRLLLRRQLLPEGKSRAFINDQPVSVALLKNIGERLVEIHGQQGQRALNDRGVQREMLDGYGQHQTLAEAVKKAYGHWKQLAHARAAKEDAIKQAAAQEDYLRHIHNELLKLSPQAGEEEELAVKRRKLMQAEKLGSVLQDVQSELEGSKPIEDSLSRAARLLSRSSDETVENPTLEQLLASLDTAQQSVAEALQSLDSLILDSGYDPKELEAIEGRLFELRGAARKHQRPVDELNRYLTEIDETLKALDSDESVLATLRKEETQAKQAYHQDAKKLSKARLSSAELLAKKVMAELTPLKMEATRFRVSLNTLPEEHWAEHGCDKIQFEISTNAGAPFGPLAKVASGGELSRFMLAMKVVLAEQKQETTLIFDEIDTGTSGAVAEAIGERLARLSHHAQVMCITHLPQVASKGTQHFRVSKESTNGQTRTSVMKLQEDERREELAIMLSGKSITDEARKQADKMLRAV